MKRTPETLTSDLLAKLLTTDSPEKLVSILGLTHEDLTNVDASGWSSEDQEIFEELRVAVEAARLPLVVHEGAPRPDALLGVFSPVSSPRARVEHETLTNQFTRIHFEPLRDGAGTTIGNALRRVLLSSLEGAAITAVKIEDISHEFSSIPGVIENATDIILNLKRIPLKLHGDEPKTIYLKGSKPGVYTSENIEHGPDVEILDKTIYIGTVSEDGMLQIEMRVQNGRGYVAADVNFDENLGIGYIPIDSLHSPIRKVNYLVEKRYAPGNHEKLTLEVWTNGGITGHGAVSLAARVIRDDLYPFINLETVGDATFETDAPRGML